MGAEAEPPPGEARCRGEACAPRAGRRRHGTWRATPGVQRRRARRIVAGLRWRLSWALRPGQSRRGTAASAARTGAEQPASLRSGEDWATCARTTAAPAGRLCRSPGVGDSRRRAAADAGRRRRRRAAGLAAGATQTGRGPGSMRPARGGAPAGGRGAEADAASPRAPCGRWLSHQLPDPLHGRRIETRQGVDLHVQPPLLDSIEQLLALQSQFFRQLVNTRGQRQLLPEPSSGWS